MKDYVGAYGFYFEQEGLAGHQGPINPSEEYFKHRQMEKAIAREMIQNSLDARRYNADCVTVEFELAMVPVADIPGIADLRVAAKSAWESNQNLQGAESLKQASASANSIRPIPVLRIGDYGTRGLTGSESVNDPTSALSALTRGSGVSSTDGSRGGSFGIGSAVGFAASRMRTVGYLSHPVDQSSVFAASARFASHVDSENVRRVPSGYFTEMAVGRSGEFQYLRNPGAFPGFAERVKHGTDVFVLDYVCAGEDPTLSRIRDAVIEDFMVAIHKGKLRVEGKGKAPWVLDKDSLESFIKDSELLRQTTQHFYTALTKGTQDFRELPGLGKVKLFIHVDPERPHSIKSGTQLMRSPYMRVQTVRHRSNTPYSAIFICDDEKGNKILRETEPPTHDEWSDKGSRSNAKVVRAIKSYVRERLAESMHREFGQELSVKGLERFLPSLNTNGMTTTSGGAKSIKPRGSAPRVQESPARLGMPQEVAISARGSAAVSLSVAKSGISSPDGDLTGIRGQRSGTKSSDDQQKTGIPTKGKVGEGRSKVKSKDIRFRSFFSKTDSAHIMTIKAERAIDGDLEIAGIGVGGAEFDLPISQAWIQMPGAKSLVPAIVSGSAIQNMKAEKGQVVHLVIKFTGDGRYRLGVSDE